RFTCSSQTIRRNRHRQLAKMKKLLQILLLASCLTTPCFAQSKNQWQLFAGYSFMRANVREYYKPTTTLYAIRDQYANLNGWDRSLTENIKSWFGGTLDASGHYGSPSQKTTVQTTSTTQRVHSFSYGPHFFHQGRKFTPFGHVLIGITHISAAVPSPG